MDPIENNVNLVTILSHLKDEVIRMKNKYVIFLNFINYFNIRNFSLLLFASEFLTYTFFYFTSPEVSFHLSFLFLLKIVNTYHRSKIILYLINIIYVLHLLYFWIVLLGVLTTSSNLTQWISRPVSTAKIEIFTSYNS